MTGVYGKLPTYGDFVRRELPQSFVVPWDAWLQDCLAAARDTLGRRFDALWEAAPAWRFRLAPGVCGSAAVVGVLLTSEDLVGRKFPMTAATLLPDDSLPPNQAWYAALEASAVAGRERGQTVDALLATLPTAALRRSLPTEGDIPAPGWWTGDGQRLDLWRLPTAAEFLILLRGADVSAHGDAGGDAGGDEGGDTGSHAGRETAGLTCGDTDADDETVKTVPVPVLLDATPARFALSGPGALGAPMAPVAPIALIAPAEPLASRAVSHRGAVRARNEDAFVDRGDIGVWAVADGAGGHGAGDVASAAAAAAIADLPVGLSAAEILAQVRLRLSAVHTDLQRRAAANGSGEIMATTIVVLMARGDHFACLWAGDSRAYLLRDGQLSQITRDHSLVQEMVESGALAAEDAEHHPQANIITRAVGSQDTLQLDKVSGRIHPGDVLLLCTDGLFKALPLSEIAQSLALGAGPEPLLQQALRAGARDNVTALIVEV